MKEVVAHMKIGLTSQISPVLGKEFRTGRGVTQRDPTSPMIFKIMVDAVLQKCLDAV